MQITQRNLQEPMTNKFTVSLMRALYVIAILLAVSIVVASVVLLPNPLLPSASKLLITSEDLASTAKLQQYLLAHTDVTMVTTSQIINSVAPHVTSETPLMVSTVQSISVIGTHPLSWERLYVLVSPTMTVDAWTPIGYWNGGVWTMIGGFSGSQYLRLFSSGMRGNVGTVTISYNYGQQVTVQMNKMGDTYSWGRWCISTSGSILYVDSDAVRVYDYIWTHRPSALMFFGGSSRVPTFWMGWIDQATNFLMSTATDHPYTVSDAWNSEKLERALPFGRIPLQTPSELAAVITKLSARTSSLEGRAVIIRDTSIGYSQEVDYMITAMQGLGMSIIKLEDGTVVEAVQEMNLRNDFIILGGHGVPNAIACAYPMIRTSDITALTFTSATIGISYGCSTSDFTIENTIAEEFVKSPNSDGRAFLGFNTLTDVPPLAFVFHEFVDTYQSLGDAEAVKRALNLLEQMWAIRKGDPSLVNDGFIIQRLCIQYFGWAW